MVEYVLLHFLFSFGWYSYDTILFERDYDSVHVFIEGERRDITYKWYCIMVPLISAHTHTHTHSHTHTHTHTVKRRPFVRQNYSEPSSQSTPDHFTPPHRNNSLPSTVMPFKLPQKPVEETGDSLSPQHSTGSQGSEVTQSLAAMDIKEGISLSN